MSFSSKARGALTEARNVLIRRRKQTDDAAEIAAIDDAIASLNDTLGLINQAALLDAAASVVDATAGLERVVSSARLGPFDDFVADLQKVLAGISDLLRDGEVGEPLVRTPPQEAAVPVSPAPPQAAPPAVSEGGLPPVGPVEKFEVMRPEYEGWFGALTVRPEFSGKVAWHVDRLLRHQGRYRDVSPLVKDVPWAMIGVIHAMECGFNFAGHLHNGDPLTGRTKHVPDGRPQTGTPPFSWEESAVDALTMEGLDKVTDWSVPHMLYLLEKYNGFGYRNRGLPTPYLWSFSNLYDKGKYVADGHFDPEAVSKQCGAAVMIKALRDRGIAIT